MKRVMLFILVIVIVFHFSAIAQRIAPLIVESDAEVLRDKATAWYLSLKSFKGDYTLEDYRPERDPQLLVYEQHFRCDGPGRVYLATNSFAMTEYSAKDMGGYRYTSMYDGKQEHLFANGQQDAINDEKKFGHLNSPYSLMPKGVFLNPLEIFEQDQGTEHFYRMWNTGVFKYFRRGDFEVLSQWVGYNCRDIWFDEEGNITRIDFTHRPHTLYPRDYFAQLLEAGSVLGFDLSQEDSDMVDIYPHLIRAWEKDPFDLRFLNYSLLLDSYRVINGVNFPMQVRRIGCARKYSEDEVFGYVDSVRESFRNQTMSFIDSEVQSTAGEIYTCIPSTYQLLRISSPEKVLINTPLAKSEFGIPKIDGTHMHDYKTDVSYIYEHPLVPWWLAVFLIAIICSLTAGIVGYGIYYYVRA